MDNSATERRPRGPLKVPGLRRRLVSGGGSLRVSKGGIFRIYASGLARLGGATQYRGHDVVGLFVWLSLGTPDRRSTWRTYFQHRTDRLRKVLDRLEDLRTGRSVLAGLADQPA